MKSKIILSITALAMAAFSSKAQLIAYDNATGYQGFHTSSGNLEIGDEIRLTTGPSVVTSFQFEYIMGGSGGGFATGIVRFWDFTGTGPWGPEPGNIIFESAPFSLLNGFHQGAINNLSVSVPERFVWTVDFSDLSGQERAGLLYYNGTGVGGGPGQSYDDHWQNQSLASSPIWVLVDSAGLVDNFAARVTVVPEPGTIALFVAGIAMVGMTLRRRKAN